MADDVTGHRIDALETAVRNLQAESVSQRWLDERFGRLHDQMNSMARSHEIQVSNMAEDIRDMKTMDRSRRMAVYTAVVVGVVSLISALVMVATTVPSPI